MSLNHERQSFSSLASFRGLITEIHLSKNMKTQKVKLRSVECPRCKLTVKVKPSEKKCPKCKYPLDRPSPEVIDKLRNMYRMRDTYNRAMDRAEIQKERKHYAGKLHEVLARISELLLKQKTYKKWFDEDGNGLLPDWGYEVTGGRPAKFEEP